MTPQSEKFIFIPNVPIKIEEADFLRKQAMRVQNSRENNFEVEKVKIQSNSDGRINNIKVNNIVFGPSSSLNITENVDMSQSSIDLPYTYND